MDFYSFFWFMYRSLGFPFLWGGPHGASRLQRDPGGLEAGFFFLYMQLNMDQGPQVWLM